MPHGISGGNFQSALSTAIGLAINTIERGDMVNIPRFAKLVRANQNHPSMASLVVAGVEALVLGKASVDRCCACTEVYELITSSD